MSRANEVFEQVAPVRYRKSDVTVFHLIADATQIRQIWTSPTASCSTRVTTDFGSIHTLYTVKPLTNRRKFSVHPANKCLRGGPDLCPRSYQ
jgi:hypothetical protein